eukprot:TRINITY_DN8562_c0_g1_i1.p1 TRINITY_DN8562_c0_g1~~TRINITY_DN8562_c0_g1_i1.p1  ORF type:complete len:652 (+),score=164.47 TRINITY_DN8562_c0_g1_i1:30-1958(+)
MRSQNTTLQETQGRAQGHANRLRGRTASHAAAKTVAVVHAVRRTRSEPCVFSFEKAELGLEVPTGILEGNAGLNAVRVDEEAVEVVGEVLKRSSAVGLRDFPDEKPKKRKKKPTPNEIRKQEKPRLEPKNQIISPRRSILEKQKFKTFSKTNSGTLIINESSPSPTSKTFNPTSSVEQDITLPMHKPPSALPKAKNFKVQVTSPNKVTSSTQPKRFMLYSPPPRTAPRSLKIEKRKSKKDMIKEMEIPFGKKAQPNTDLIWEEEKGIIKENDEILGITESLIRETLLEGHNVHWVVTNIIMHDYLMGCRELLEYLKSNVGMRKRRVYEFMVMWMRYNHHDFRDGGFCEEVVEFVERWWEGGEKVELMGGLSGVKNLSSSQEGQLKPLTNKKITKLSEISSILVFNPTEIARQLTLIDHQLFRDIPPIELLHKHFTKEDQSPALQKLANRFNQITGWVGTTIVMEPEMKRRRKLICHFIAIAAELLQLNNFAGLMAMFVGLTQCCVSRMNLTWKSIPSNFMDKWVKLETLCSPLGNFRNLRNLHDNSPPPSVKAPTLFLKDLTFIEEIETYLPLQGGLPCTHLNFNKLQQIGRLLTSIALAQRTSYPLTPVPLMQDYLLHLPFLSPDLRDDLSKLNEKTVKES